MDRESILKDYSQYLSLKEIRSAEDYLRTVGIFLSWLTENNIKLSECRTKTASDFKAFLLADKKKQSHGTINNKLNRLRGFGRFLCLRGLLLENPFADLAGLRKGLVLPKNILSIAEMERLLAGFSLKRKSDFMLKALVELLYGSALRISEAATIKMTDIDFKSRCIKIHDHKNDKERLVPLTESALRAIENYREIASSSLYLFPQQKKTTLRCHLNNKLASECKRLGLKKITSHCFRHSAASHLLRNGAGIRQVQAFLGHEKINTTVIYTRVVKEDLKKVIAACHPREAGHAGS